jgi:uncharacterized membrane protein
MDAASVWKFLHIAFLFVAVSIFVGQGMLVGAVARSGDVLAVRRMLVTEERFGPVGGAMFLLGIVFGFVTALTSDLDLTATWLLIGYALSIFILVNGLTYHQRQAEKLRAAAAASPEDQPSDQLRGLAGAPSVVVMNVIDGLAWLGLIFVMVTKPFS